MGTKIPKGWVKTTFGEIAEWSSGGTPSRSKSEYYGGTIPWIKSGDLNDNTITEVSESITELGLKNSSAKIFPKGSVGIAMYGATIGKTSLFGIDASTNQAVAVAQSYEGINNVFLHALLKSQKQAFIDKGKGGAQPNISQTVIKAHAILLPPLPEQKRIVAKLDALFGHFDLLKTKLNHIPELLKNFRQQVLTQAVTGKLTEEWRKGKELEDGNNLLMRIKKKRLEKFEVEKNESIKEGIRKPKKPILDIDNQNIMSLSIPVNWAYCSVGEIGDVSNGSTPSRSMNEYWGGKIPWVSSGLVQNNHINETREFITELGFKNSSVRLLPKGTVLIAMIGEGKTRGQSSILEIAATINQNIAAIVIDLGLVISEYLYFWLLFNYDNNRKQGNGTGPQALNCQRVRELEFVLPPTQEQQEIVRRVEQLFAFADKIESQYQSLKDKIENLPQAILNKAFKGELVEQDENDEPASELLKRIKKEKDTGIQNTKTKQLKSMETGPAVAAEDGVVYNAQMKAPDNLS